MRSKAKVLVVVLAGAIFASSPASATFPGRAGRIVIAASIVETRDPSSPSNEDYCGYVNESDLYTMRSNGRGLEKLADIPGYDEQPEWSPGGRWIAFSNDTEDEEGSDIWIVRSDGKRPSQVTDFSDSNVYPTWSRDGRRIAFARYTGGTETLYEIYSVRRDGTRLKHLTQGSNDTFPAWSPDGRRIAFVRDSDISTMRPDGSRVRQLTVEATRKPKGQGGDTFGGISTLDWSPNGKKLYFAMNRGEGRTYVYSIRVDGTGFRRLQRGEDPVMSPNGQRIVFEDYGEVRTDCTPELYKMEVDGSNVRELHKRDRVEISSMDWRAR